MREGMTQDEFSGNCSAAFRALGVQGGVFCSFGKYTAFPHGSSTPQKLKEGDVVLMDGGCSVDGYQSDITRTFVFGKPTPAATRDLEPRAQIAGCRFRRGEGWRACEAVDAAARKVITDAGLVRITKCPACRIAPVMASDLTVMNGQTSCAATRRRFNRECVLAMNRRS